MNGTPALPRSASGPFMSEVLIPEPMTAAGFCAAASSISWAHVFSEPCPSSTLVLIPARCKALAAAVAMPALNGSSSELTMIHTVLPVKLAALIAAPGDWKAGWAEYLASKAWAAFTPGLLQPLLLPVSAALFVADVEDDEHAASDRVATASNAVAVRVQFLVHIGVLEGWLFISAPTGVQARVAARTVVMSEGGGTGANAGRGLIAALARWT